ncbi:CDP-glycerol glycerophosphotransferase family protein [Priestia flexa]|uniref:CDP-glycerol glycerophosphotransferase family protein n=1 Tax=Priestia flexa TaxID=86664 RepID=UPI001A8D6D1D|nr:CDP-glycerol glycerophosphotransferase family protein [Priestia flexa]MBN8433050.1 CDP-glycerol glycerophosphotransferase family protein [Priestia flexa]MCA0965576.1 CDP-glycerol glycerophosphotransferase family protein [Priestia flexa]
MFKKIFSCIIAVILLIVSIFIKKDKNIWVYSAWHGNKFTDNPKHMYLYMIKNHKEIRSIWITNNKNVISEVKSVGEVYYRYSVKGIYYCMKSGVVLFSHRVNDVNFRVLFLNSKLIQLWHGMPLKKINLDIQVKISNSYFKNKLIYLKRKAQILEFNRYSLLIATSYSTAQTIKSAFNLNSVVKITGQPRNDVMENDFRKNHNEKDIFHITFMPTFRENDLKPHLYFLNSEYIYDLYQLLKDTNSKMILKLHFHDQTCIKIPKDLQTHIEFAPSNLDTQELLNNTDLLITDYSSCYIDFLLTKKPILFSVPDYEEYLNIERGFYYDYDRVTPGVKVFNYQELKRGIERYREKPYIHLDERLKVCDIFDDYKDNQNSYRVFKEIQSLLK